jgi:outer membrane protein TolC
MLKRTNRKPLAFAFLGVALVVGVGIAWAADAPLGADVESLLEYARANPEYASMRHEAEAAAQRVYPAGAFPDPVLRVELENITNAGSDAPPSLLPSKVGDTKYTLMQSIPFFGKRGLRRDVAEAEVNQAQGRAAATWAEIASNIKMAYARYYAVVRNEELTREILDLMGRLERIAVARYEGGLVPQQDAIRAQVELTTMRGELVMLESERESVKATLNALLARPRSAPLALPERLRSVPQPVKLQPDVLTERLRERNPQLFTEEARIRGAEKTRELTYRNRYPDFTVGLMPMQMGSRIEQWGVMVEVNIPLQQEARRRQEAEAEAMLWAARERRESTANRLVGELNENLAALDAATRIETLTTSSLLPQSQATLDSALASYETGKIDFATLLDAQRAIRKSKLDRIKAQVDAQSRLAAIERLLGEDL